MREVAAQIEQWIADGESIAIATVAQTWGSWPRRIGAKLALTANGEMCGSVSGGCVEGVVYETGLDMIKTGRPQLLHFGCRMRPREMWVSPAEVRSTCSYSNSIESGTRRCGLSSPAIVPA